MNSIVAILLYGMTATLIGCGIGAWLHRLYTRMAASDRDRDDARRAADALERLHQLATSVAVDVQEHSGQVEEISESLTAADGGEPAMVLDVMARLIQANQQMQEKLNSTEDKLREQASQIEQHAAEARTDALTLLANRRAFDDELARRIGEFRRQRRGFSLILVDLDHFKRLNDQFGHQTGDEVLRGAARVLRRKMREMDLVARYGGEEFAVILPGTDLNAAAHAAQRAVEGMRKCQVRNGDDGFQVTASFGVAEFLENEDLAGIVSRADTALYAAKEGGRNCVFRHTGKTVERVVADSRESIRKNAIEPSKQMNVGPTVTAGPTDTECDDDLPNEAQPDTVFGLLSRTTFCLQARNLTTQWQLGSPGFSVMMIDVKYCDDLGNQLGHRPTEVTTRWTAQFLAKGVGKGDVLGHYASGCFAVLLPEAELVDTIRIAEQLRNGLAGHSACQRPGHPQPTLSIGVVEITAADDSIALLKRAEAALDTAIRVGGNCTYFHDGEKCLPVTAVLELSCSAD